MKGEDWKEKDGERMEEGMNQYKGIKRGYKRKRCRKEKKRRLRVIDQSKEICKGPENRREL